MHSLVDPQSYDYEDPSKPRNSNEEILPNGARLIKDIHLYYKEKYGDDYMEIFKMHMKLMEHSKTQPIDTNDMDVILVLAKFEAALDSKINTTTN